MRTPTLPRNRLARVVLFSAVGIVLGAAPAQEQPGASDRPSDVLKRALGAEKAKPSRNRERLSTRSSRPAARWLGQDGHDLAGPATAPAPSGVQDIHIALSGLPRDRVITFAAVRPLGGGEWLYKGPHGPWGAALVCEAGSNTAELYVEPYQAETGRPMSILVKFDDGGTLELEVKGGKADPNLRVPSAMLQAKWIGQGLQDRTGPGPAVGPDGIQDARIALVNLSPHVDVRGVRIELATAVGWQFGENPKRLNNAELVRHPADPSKAELFFNPERDLAGKELVVVVDYRNGTSDRARLKAGRVDPMMATPRPAPVTFVPNAIRARWLGQDASDTVGSGDVHVALEGLPINSRIAAAALNNAARGSWTARLSERVPFTPQPFSMPLVIRQGGDASRAELAFPPDRDETGGTMTLRLVFEDGKATLVTFPGGASDPSRRAGGRPAPTSVVARPGDDLTDLADRFGKVTLSRGTYTLTRPLVLNKPVTITAVGGATLQFSQAPTDPGWAAAIEIHASHTTLDGFAVRFSAPVRWRPGLSFGPSVVRTFEGAGEGPDARKSGIVLTRLDLEAPPAAGPGPWEDAVALARLLGVSNGRIDDNVLKGGTIEVFDGPWKIERNEFRGAQPGTASQAVFACHDPHDVVLKGNTAHAVAPAGKTWRFLLLTGSGTRDQIEGNRIEGIGPRDDDTIPNANAPEIVLTEAYSLHFEGQPLAISPDGRVVQIPPPQGEPARAGDGLAILSGPEAGGWRRIAQAIDATTYLVDRPLPTGDYAISIATGFVDETFAGNTIDARGGSVAANLVLVGNHFGTTVRNNHLLGAGESYKLTAAPTERPGRWGWSHAPFVGVLIEGNTIEDSIRGGSLCVEHGAAVKSSQGRVYLSATLTDNTGVWTEGFLRAQPKAPRGERLAFTIGHPESKDPGEAIVMESGNRVRAPADSRPGVSMRVHSASVNGRPVREQGIVLAPAAGTSSASKPSQAVR